MQPQTGWEQPSPPPPAVPVPGPAPRRHRLRNAAFVALAVVMVGAVVFLATSLSTALSKQHQYQTALASARSSLKRDDAALAKAQAELRSQASSLKQYTEKVNRLQATVNDDQAQIVGYENEIARADEVPPGGYAAFQANLLQGLQLSQHVSSASTVDCVLPSTWTPGGTFNCDVFAASGTSLGTADITIETTNPGEPFSYEYIWYPASSGY